MKEFYQNLTESLNELTEMSRRISILLSIVVVLLYVANASGKDLNQRKQCKKNEYWSSRGSCERSCVLPNGNLYSRKTSGCICRKGFVRNMNGECTESTECRDEKRGPVLFDNRNTE